MFGDARVVIFWHNFPIAVTTLGVLFVGQYSEASVLAQVVGAVFALRGTIDVGSSLWEAVQKGLILVYRVNVANYLCLGVWLGRKTATRQRQSPKVRSGATETSRGV